MSTITLSLADVAALARVQRPVVSMWRQRDKDGLVFPDPLPDGRFEGAEIVDYLERTGRGKNPDPRAELAVHAVTAADQDPDRLAQLMALLTARTLLDEPVGPLDRDDLLDAVDELDPDDDFLFSEVEALDAATLAPLAAEADAVADAAWHPRAAYERLHDALHRHSTAHDERLDPHLTTALAEVVRGVLGVDGCLVDVDGTCADVVLSLTADEDFPTPALVLPWSSPPRDVVRRYRTQGIRPRVVPLAQEWSVPEGSVVLIRLPGDPSAAFDLLHEVATELPVDACAVVIGPAALLTDPLAAAERRDELLRGGVVRGIVRLPAGLTRGGARQHLAVWLMVQPDPHPVGRAGAFLVGDISGRAFDRPLQLSFVDDLVAAAGPVSGRAFDVLELADRRQAISRGGSLVAHDRARAVAYALDPAGDAARIADLRAGLLQPLPDPFPFTALAAEQAAPCSARMGDAQRHGLVKLLPGTRVPELPAGSTRLWTAEAVAAGVADSVDLLALTLAVPSVKLTEPGDVVFTTKATPRAVVDAAGGSAVAYPARVLRVTSPKLAPSAVAAAINRLPPGNAQWQTWELPVLQIDEHHASAILDRLDALEADLRRRQAEADELRRLVTRSVLSGAITVIESPTLHEKGR
ncbi:MAG: hypothetical protein Q4G46_02345 [Propionibacteriaceae bacterium]|nr:hypothetical protein [Propionibacteriaceae bacterium]